MKSIASHEIFYTWRCIAVFKRNFPTKKGQALIDSFQTILTGYQKDQSPSRAITLNSLGRMYLTVSDYTHAMQCLSESFAIAEAFNDEELKAATYKNISIVYFGQHQYNKALEYCSKAFAIFDKRNNLPKKAMLLKITGDNFLQQGDSTKASGYYNAANQ